MNKKLYWLGILAAALLPVLPLSAQKMDGSKINSVTMDWVTPHQTWAEKFSGGKLQVLYCVMTPRDVVEIAQRGDTTTDVIAFAPRHLGDIFGYTRDDDGYYGSLYEGTSETEKQKDLVAKLATGKYQVIVIGGVDFNKMNDEAKYALFRAVKMDGVGLILLRCRNTPKGLVKNTVPNNIMAMYRTNDSDSLSYSYDPIAGKTVMQKSSPNEQPYTYQFGKGRVLVYGGSTQTLIHAPLLYRTPRWWGAYENAFAKTFRTLLWTAQRLPEQNVSFEQNGADVKLSGLAGNTKLRLRDAWNKTVFEKPVTGDNVSLTLPDIPAGNYSLDVISSDAEGVTNIGLFTVSVNPGVTGTLTADDDSIKGFDPIRTTVKLSRPLKNATMTVFLADSPDQRVWWKKTMNVPEQAEFPVTISDYFMPNLAAFVNVEITENGKKVLKMETPVYFPTWMTDRMPLYHDDQWEYNPGGSDLIRSLAEVQVMGFGTSFNRLDGDRPDVQSTMLRNCRLSAWITSFDANLAKRGDKDRISLGFQQPYDWEVRATKMSKEDQALIAADKIWYHSPASKRVAELKVQAEFNNKNLQKYPIYFYQTGNECGMREFENYGYTKEDNEAFKVYLKERYGTIENLNRLWDRSYKSFDEVPNMRMRDAQKEMKYPEYRAHYDYVCAAFTEYCHNIADEIHRLAPHGNIGVDGAWTCNGFNMETLFANKNINYWAPYTSKHIGMHQLRCMRPDVKPFLVWGWIMKGNAMPEAPWFSLLVSPIYESSWYISGPSVGGIHTASDYRPYNMILQNHLNDLREGKAQLLNSVPLASEGLAIWQNDASDRASALSDSRISQIGDSTLPLFDWCYAHGVNFEYIFPHNIDNLKNYKVLVLPAAVALNEKDVKKIYEFAENGGLVIADINPGLMNDSYGMFDKSIASSLFGDWNPKKIQGITEYAVDINTVLNGQNIKLKGSVGGTPGIAPFQVKKIGKGYAVLLNFTLGKASLCCSAKEYDNFMLSLFAAGGIRPEIQTSGLPDNTIFRIRRTPGMEVFGFTNRSMANAGENGGEASFKLPAKKYVYAVKEGFLGYGDTFKFQFAPPFRLFSVFDREQKAPELDLPRTAEPGKPVMIDLKEYAPHTVLLLQVRDSKGNLIRFRNEAPSHEVIVTDGKTKEFPFCFAYTDPKGEYEVTLMNVATGLKTVKTITLK